jgi:hypothetical protein
MLVASSPAAATGGPTLHTHAHQAQPPGIALSSPAGLAPCPAQCTAPSPGAPVDIAKPSTRCRLAHCPVFTLHPLAACTNRRGRLTLIPGGCLAYCCPRHRLRLLLQSPLHPPLLSFGAAAPLSSNETDLKHRDLLLHPLQQHSTTLVQQVTEPVFLPAKPVLLNTGPDRATLVCLNRARADAMAEA